MNGVLPFRDPVSVSYRNRELAPLPDLRAATRVGLDWETDLAPNYRRKGYGFSYYVDENCKGYVSLFHPESVNYDPDAVRRWMNEQLRGKTIACAEAKHEIAVTRNFGVSLEDLGCKMKDVFFPPALLDEKRRRINLDMIAREELSEGKIELTGTDLWPIHERPADQVAGYAVQDSRLAVMLDDAYAPKIAEQELDQVLDLENSIVYANEEMERNGTYLDVETLLRWRKEVQDEHEKRIWDLHRATGMNINPGSSDDMQRLFKHLNLVPLTAKRKNKETGKITESDTFSEEALLSFNHPVLNVAVEVNQLGSLLSKFLNKYVAAAEPDGRLRYVLHQLRGDEHGTITGRYSCGGGENSINIQQVSKNSKQPVLLQRWPLRSLFVPPKGRRWFSADASQIEFRIFAYYAEKLLGSRRLADAYRSDLTKGADEKKTDPHALIAEWTGLIRDEAKNVNFCKLYGGGPEKVALMCKCSIERGHEIDKRYDQRFYEAKALISIAQKQAETVNFVRTLDGRRRRYGPGDRMYSALNAVFQGTAASIMKRKIRELYENRKRFDLTMRFPVHDEEDGDVPDDHIEPIRELLNEQTTAITVPIMWEAATGDNWHAAH